MARDSKCEQIRRCLREYLLESLSDCRQRAAADHLRGCEACRAALEVERQRIAVLDALAVEEAPEGLAERTLAQLGPAVSVPRIRPLRLVVNVVAIAASILVFLSVVSIYQALESGGSEASRRAATQGNMKQFGLVFKMFANESKGERWPALAVAKGGWVPELAPLHGEFITDAQIMVSEQHPDKKRLKQALAEAWNAPEPDFESAARLMGESFSYLGYSVKDEADFEALARAKTRNTISSEDSAVLRADGGAVEPLREGVERFMITDINNPGASASAQASIPVLIEIATWKHKKSEADYKGANVLYMDGHVEFVKLGAFPVLPSIMDTLSK